MIAPGAPALTLKTVPGLGVEVFFASLHVDVERITVFRISDGETVPVRGGLKVSASGAFAVTDWEVPFGVVSTYYGEVFDAGGASLIGAQASTTAVSDDVVLSNPVDPSQQVPVNLEYDTFTQISRQRRTEQVYVMGVRLPFEQNWGLGGISSMPFTVWTETDPDALALDVLLQSSPVLIRTPPRFATLPRNLFASIKSPTQLPFDWRSGGTTIVWQLVVDEVQPVSAAVLRPLVTYQRWLDAYPSPATYGDVQAVYGGGTYIDAERNPPIV